MMDTSSSDYNYPVPYNANVTLQVMLRCDLTQEQVSRLFDLVPGMEYCEMNDRGRSVFLSHTGQWLLQVNFSLKDNYTMNNT